MRTILVSFALLTTICGRTQSLVPGQSYYGSNNYTEYINGTLPVIISAPHGGRVRPSSIPTRTSACGSDVVTVLDTNTEELARAIDSCLYVLTGQHAHTVLCLLSRQKMDANRPMDVGACGNATAEEAWKDYQNFIDSSQQRILRNYGRGLFIDVHGHGHTVQRNEIGYLLSGAELREDDAIINTADYTAESSIRYLAWKNTGNLSHAGLVRGAQAFGTLLANAGYPSVPSVQDPYPLEDQSYFNGGYNTQRWGSRNGGKIDAFQIETNYTGVRNNAASIAAFADTMAHVIMRYMQLHFPAPDTLPALSTTPFSPGNLLVTRFATGVTGMQRITLLEIDTASHSVVQTVDLPSSGPDATIVTDGQLQRSANGRYVSVGGYFLDEGATLSVTGTAVNRAVAAIDASAKFISRRLPNASAASEYGDPYNGSNIRSVYTGDGNRFYIAGGSTSTTNTTTGVWVMTKDTPSLAAQVNVLANTRWVQMFKDTLYAAAQSVTGRAQGIFRFNPPTPLGNADTMRLFTPLNNGLVGFAFTPDRNTCYVGINSSSSHVEKWQFNGVAWVYRYTLNPTGVSTAPRAFTLQCDSANAHLFITYGSQVIKLIDNIANTSLAAASLTPILVYAENTAGAGLRGICFTPEDPLTESATVARQSSFSKDNTVAPASLGRELHIYPNPANGRQITVVHEKAGRNASISLVGSQGKVLRQLPVKEGDIKTELHMTGYPAGTYIIAYYNNGKKSVGRIIR